MCTENMSTTLTNNIFQLLPFFLLTKFQYICSYKDVIQQKLMQLLINLLQICIPIKEEPTYKCICKSGYELNYKDECVLVNPSLFLLYGQQKPGIVKGLDLESPQNEVMLPMIDLGRPTALDYHAEANLLYLADSQKLRIERQNLLKGHKETFIETRLNSVMGMAVDWVGNNLYWTDEGLRSIFVADLRNSTRRATIINEGMFYFTFSSVCIFSSLFTFSTVYLHYQLFIYTISCFYTLSAVYLHEQLFVLVHY